MQRVSCLLVLATVLCFYAVPANALAGFVGEAQFRSFDPFAVDVYVDFFAPINMPVGLGPTSYYEYDFFYLAQGGFPIRDSYAAQANVLAETIDTTSLGGVTFSNGADTMIATTGYLVGIQFDSVFNAMGFFLSDQIDHNRGYVSGEYITRGRQSASSILSIFDFDFQGVNDVFVGYINDVVGFRGLWAGWYRGRPSDTRDVDSADYAGQFNGISHFLSPAAYVGAGGDPHMALTTQVSRSTSSEMSNLLSGDIVNLIDSPHVSVNAAIREFSFLPASMRENNYFGTVAAQLASGDRVLVEAFEAEEGAPAFSVSLNGAELEEGALVEAEAFRVQYDRYELLDGASGHSWFEEQFPFQQHGAIVRVWVYGEIVVDVSLTSKDHFVDWHHAQPQVHEQAGAFLNVNTRDLRQDAETAGLLRVVDGVHKRKLMRERALEAGAQLEERDIDVDFQQVVHNVVDAHRVESLF